MYLFIATDNNCGLWQFYSFLAYTKEFHLLRQTHAVHECPKRLSHMANRVRSLDGTSHKTNPILNSSCRGLQNLPKRALIIVVTIHRVGEDGY